MSNSVPDTGPRAGNRADDLVVSSQTRTEQVTRRGRRNLGGWWWLALALVPLLLAGLTALFTHNGVENDLRTRTTQALTEAGYDGAQVDFSGRDGTVTLTGGDAAAARQVAQGVDGVRVVSVVGGAATDGSTGEGSTTDGGSATGPGDFELSVSEDGSAITVNAVVPDESAKQALLDAVRAAKPEATITDQVTVQADAPGLPTAGLTSLLGALGDTPGVSISGAGSAITLSGAVASDAIKQSVASAAQALNPAASVDNQLTVDPNLASGEGSADAATDGATDGASEGSADGSDVSAACTTVNTQVSEQLKANPIKFATGSATLVPASATAVRGIADSLKDCLGTGGGATGLTVEGHTDNTGNAAFNTTLSQQRADAVKAELVKGGLAADKITATGFGADQPIADNAAESGRAANRRVEIQLT